MTKGQKVVRTRNARSRTIDWRRAISSFLIATLVVPVMVVAPNSQAQAEQIQISAETR